MFSENWQLQEQEASFGLEGRAVRKPLGQLLEEEELTVLWTHTDRQRAHLWVVDEAVLHEPSLQEWVAEKLSDSRIPGDIQGSV